MKSSFGKSSGTLAARLELYETIQHEMSLIRRDKLAAHCDLDACFMLHDEKRGYLGHIFKQESARTINRLIVARNHEGRMEVYPLPSTLASTQTRALLDRLYPSSTPAARARREDREWLYAVTGLEALAPTTDEDDCPSRLNLFYVGDFLDCVEDAINLEWRIKNSVLRGDGDNTLEIVKRLRQVPDYSQHFPDRCPPGPGKRQRQSPDTPARVPSGSGWQPA